MAPQSTPAAKRKRWWRGLRPRLTLSYVLFFTLLLTFIGLFFIATLKRINENQVRTMLDQEWGAIRGYLRIERGRPVWFYDPRDPEEAFTVERLRRVYLLADSWGRVIQVSDEYRALGVDAPWWIQRILRSQTPYWSVRNDATGVPHMVRSGLIFENRQPYYLAIGMSLAESNRVVDEFTRNYFLMLPLLLALASVLGWFVAGRALAAIDDLSRTRQRITGSNLSTRIPPRGADDELDRLIYSFNRMIERLDQSFTQTRQFSMDVSHELRTPLTSIRGQLEVALFSCTTVEQYRDAIATALEEVERLSHTVRALLQLSQAESGQLVLQREPLDLARIARNIAEQFEIPAEAAGLNLSTEIAETGEVEADRVQIERLLNNLISNALKYTPEGGDVSLSVARRPDAVEIVVSDTGIGIPEEHLPHIFERFYRVHSVPRAAEHSLGLGLSFVAWIVRAHGGTIDVQSAPGKGTTFIVRLPVLPAASPGYNEELSVRRA